MKYKKRDFNDIIPQMQDLAGEVQNEMSETPTADDTAIIAQYLDIAYRDGFFSRGKIK